jgi:hypothetical protein
MSSRSDHQQICLAGQVDEHLGCVALADLGLQMAWRVRLNTSRTARSSMALACSSRLASAPHGIRRTWDRSSAAEASRPQPPEDQHCWRWLLRWRSANWLCSEPSYSDHNSFPYRTWQRGRRRLWLGGRLAAPGCPPARRHHAGGGIRWRPRRGCCAPPGSSVG